MHLQWSLCPWKKCYLLSLASSSAFSDPVAALGWNYITDVICATEPFQQAMGMTGVR